MRIILNKKDIQKGHIEFTKKDIEYLNKIKPKGKSILVLPILEWELI